MVAIEILLGDKQKASDIGLGNLISNRCAYLIGKSQTQRNDILKKFKKIYDIRSQIVHNGHSKLNSKEKDLFYTLQWICRRVIQEEVELVKKEKL